MARKDRSSASALPAKGELRSHLLQQNLSTATCMNNSRRWSSALGFTPRPTPFRCSGPHSPSLWDPLREGGCRSARLRKAAVETGSPNFQGSPAVNLLYPVYRRISFLACAGLYDLPPFICHPRLGRECYMTESSGYSRNLLTISRWGNHVNFNAFRRFDWGFSDVWRRVGRLWAIGGLGSVVFPTPPRICVQSLRSRDFKSGLRVARGSRVGLARG
jgi:hypothetical protein